MLTTITKLSELTGLSRDTIRKRLASILTGERAELVDSTQALPLIYTDGAERLDPAQEKARLDRTRREIAELEYKQRRRELISLPEVMRVVEIATVSCREGLQGIPGRYASILAAETDAWAIEHMLDAEIRDALNKVASMAEGLAFPKGKP